MSTTSAPLSKIETETMRRITWRLLPFFMVCYFISYVDRVNAELDETRARKVRREPQVAGCGLDPTSQVHQMGLS